MVSLNKNALWLALLTCSTTLLLDLRSSQAEFELNFRPISGDDDRGDGGWGGGGGFGGGWGGGFEFSADGMTQELVNDGGQEFWHVIINDETADFGIEYFIQTASGNYRDRGAGPRSSSFGDPRNAQNFEDPFQPEAGTGTGNPERVYMRMLLNDDEIQQEFLKARLAEKPVITQSIDDGVLDSTVVIDMTNSTHDQLNIAGLVDIRSIINDPEFVDNDIPGLGNPIPGFSGSANEFDLDRDGETVNVSAGQYTYEPGSGPGGSLGTYTYAGGAGFDVYSIDWVSFCDPSQNSGGGGGGGGWGGGWGGDSSGSDCDFDGSNRGDRGGRGGGW